MTSAGTDQALNLAKGKAFCRQGAALGADIALFPEMWNNGYRLPSASSPLDKSQAVSQDSSYVRQFCQLAQQLGLAIGLTYLEDTPEGVRNALSLIDRHGQLLYTYAKVHTCEFDAEKVLTPGKEFYVAPLDTAHGMLQVGAMICFDREFPESARILMLKGAELILVPNACEMANLRTTQLQTRAYENMLALALCNYAAPEQDGHSVAFDGIAFTQQGTPRDMLLTQAGPQEGIYLARLDLEALRSYRQNEVWGNAYRRPHCYADLVAEAIKPPFVRPDATR